MLTLATAFAASLLAAPGAGAALDAPSLPPVVVTRPAPRTIARAPRHEPAPYVRLWLGGSAALEPGERPEVYFRTDEDAHVVVVRVDTDGRQEILFPERRPDGQYVRGGRTYRVEPWGRGYGAFRVESDPGIGYVFALASWDRFDLDDYAYGHGSQYRLTGRRIAGDPFVAMEELAEELLDDRYADYAMDYVEYRVGGRHYDYPRFLCYQCHGYRSYRAWNPYAHSCRSYGIVIWDDPWRHGYHHRRTSVIHYGDDRRRLPRYEFKETAGRPATGGRDVPFIEHRTRSDDTDRRRPGMPATDPNIVVRGRSDPGMTRPGDDVAPGATSRRRRVQSGASEPAPGTITPRPPRRDVPPDERDPDRPRQDPPREPRPEPRAEPRQEPRAEPRREESGERSAEPRPQPRREPRTETRTERRREPAAQPRSEPRRSSGGSVERRRRTP